MSGFPWSYRIELVDGPSRTGSFERDGKKAHLPALIGISHRIEGEGLSQDLQVAATSWSGIRLELVRSEDAGGPWETFVERFLRRNDLDRLVMGIGAMRSVLVADGEALPLSVPGLLHLLYPDPRAFSEALVSLQGDWPSSLPIYLPGIANGDNLEALLYLGIEVMDTSGAHADASDGLYYTNEGREPLVGLRQRVEPSALCHCPECQKGVPDPGSLGRHNVSMMERRLALAEMMLREGRLRSLVMGKMSGKPALAALVRRMESSGDLTGTALTYRKDMVRPITYRDDIRDPDVQSWARRVREEYAPHPGRKVLLLLPCSARKPYSASRTHQRIRGHLASVKGWRDVCQQVVVTSPLGAVPLELDTLYPSAYYDIPVTGEWYPEEIALMREMVLSIASKGAFSDIVCHHPEGGEIFEGEVLSGKMGDASFHLADGDSSLRDLVLPLVERHRASAPGSESADACSLLRFSLGADIPWGTEFRTRRTFDRTEIFLGRTNVAEVKKGGPVPSLEGGRSLWEHGWGRKVVIDDFVPKGTVFTQGILRTEGTVRPGDIVLVGTEAGFRGVGRAVLPGRAMASGGRGNAVRMLSYVKG